MTNQHIFDLIVNHLASQKKRSSTMTDKGIEWCLRGDDGCRCSIGILIKDEFYDEKFEGKGLWYPPIQNSLIKSFKSIEVKNLFPLIQDLQVAHDYSQNASMLKGMLAGVAQKHGVNFDPAIITDWM